MSKVTNFAPFLESILLRMSLMRSSNVVLVPTLPGYVMFWTAMLMRVLSGSAFSGLTLHTTFEKATPFSVVGGDVFVMEHVERVGAFHALLRRVVWVNANALAQTAKLVAV